MGILVAVIAGVFTLFLVAGLTMVLETLSRGIEASEGGPSDASPFSAPDIDAEVRGVTTGLPANLSWAFRYDGLLTRGWGAVKRFPVPLFLGGFALTVLDSCSNNNGSFGDLSELFESEDSESVGLLLSGASDTLAQSSMDGMEAAVIAAAAVAAVLVIGFVIVFSLVIGIVKAWLTNGWLELHRTIILEGEADLSRLFTSVDRAVSIWLTRFISGLVVGIFIVASMIPGGSAVAYTVSSGSSLESDPATLVAGAIVSLLLLIGTSVYVGLGVWLAPWFAVYDRSGPWSAMLQSWAAARGNRVTLFVFSLVQGLISFVALIVGILMLCVGAMFTVPIARAINDLATSYAWLSARHGNDAAERFHI